MAYSWIQLAHTIEPRIEGVNVTISGYVSSLPVLQGIFQRFDFQVDTIRDQDNQETLNPGLIRLYWYKPYPELIPGDKLSLTVRLRRPHGLMNPGGFDYETWLYKEGIRATGYVRDGELTITPAGERDSIHYFRYLLRARLDKLVENEEAGLSGLLHALMLGDRSGISHYQNHVLAASGTSHLLAISGLHIGLVAGFAFFIVRWLWPFWLPGIRRLPAQYFAAVFALVAALFYALLAGFSVPTQRALIMLSLVLLSFLRRREIQRSTVPAIALLLVLLRDPLAVLSGGFWLSFLAVTIIMLALRMEIGRGRHSKLRQWWRVQACIYLGLVPPLILMFNRVPLLSIIANIVAIPWVSFITMPLLLCAALLQFLNAWLASLLMHAGLLSLNAIWLYLEFLAKLTFTQMVIAEPTLITLVTSGVGIGLLLMPRAMPARYIGVFWLLPLFFPVIDTPASHGDYDVTVLDVGQGLAVVIRTRKHLVLYDAGPGSAAGFNAASSVIIPYLRYSGENNIDKIILSHGDNDHIGGLSEVIHTLPVSIILSSVPQRTGFTPVSTCESGQAWTYDGVRFTILHPGFQADFRANDASCVVKIGEGPGAVLLTGDIEKSAESRLLADYADDLAATILLVPHHGSKTSSGPEFIRAVAAETVIISSGYLNRFRLPNQDIIERYRLSGASIMNTAVDGAISVRFRDGEFSVSTERLESSKFWNFKH